MPVRPLGSCHICELWHGPTLAFKDLGLQVLGALLDHFLAKRRSRLMILVGTSGDTGLGRGLERSGIGGIGMIEVSNAEVLSSGSSAIEAVRGKEALDILVLFPQVWAEGRGLLWC